MTDTIQQAAKKEGKKTPAKKPETPKKGGGVKEFFRKYIRVLKLARRPTKQEFWKISAVAALGIAIIGIIGFLIYLLFYYLLP
ncbi:MAG TPA: protein translocase SEC61 complex subunit gamma [Methanocorpusculum sp.]|nr:protein translocase SEC61 complex subunit gamma [Methanocorpusculum sp.]